MCLSNPISRTLDISGICYDTSFIIWQEISIWGKITCFELSVVVLMLLCRNDPSDLLVWDWTVREITKSNSTFSATNISINIVGLLKLHDTIRMKSIFGTRFSSIYLAKGEKRLDFRLSFVDLQRAKDGTHRRAANPQKGALFKEFNAPPPYTLSV